MVTFSALIRGGANESFDKEFNVPAGLGRTRPASDPRAKLAKREGSRRARERLTDRAASAHRLGKLRVVRNRSTEVEQDIDVAFDLAAQGAVEIQSVTC